MNTLTKLALGLVGQLKLAPASGDLHGGLPLPSPRTTGGAPLMDVLRRRHILIDIDPARPSGISATADEQAASWATVRWPRRN